MVAMSARDALFNDIWDMRTAKEKNALIDAFAHELAERQRASGVDDYCWGTRCECGQHGGVADLIDPLKDAT